MTEYEITHGLSQDAPGPLEPVEVAKVPESMNTEWKPIESAPKDGTPVLLFARHIYAESSTRVVGAYLLDYGWLAQSYAGQGSARLDPSHWMALPPFPGAPPAPTSHPIPTGATGEDDIVQRLRDNADLDAAEDGNPAVIRLEREAANEIERLRRALADAPAAGDALDAEELRCRVLSAIHDCAQLKPEDDETWDEWYCAAFDLLGTRIGEIFRAAIAQQQGGAA